VPQVGCNPREVVSGWLLLGLIFSADNGSVFLVACGFQQHQSANRFFVPPTACKGCAWCHHGPLMSDMDKVAIHCELHCTAVSKPCKLLCFQGSLYLLWHIACNPLALLDSG
jgi:hypothetical protein